MRTALLLPLLALLAGLAIGLPSGSSAQSSAFVTTIENEFPQFLRFRLRTTAPSEVSDVTLRYRVVGSGALARAKPDEFEPSADVRADVRVPTGILGFIPVGSEFVFHWELTLADGSTLESEEERYVYLPPGKVWSSVHNDFMRVYFHGNEENTARRLLEAAERTYVRMGRLLQTELEVVPVNTVLFASESDLEDANPNRSETYDAATFLCGSQVANNVIFVIDQSCGTRDPSDTLRHEFTHILVEAAGEGGLGKVPAWLNEGTAVYSQTEPGQSFENPFELAAITDRLIPFTTMTAGNNNPNQVGLFYGQSYAMVDFLIETGGAEKFARLFATIKAGNRFDHAIEMVYGWTFTEFENEFRAYHELPPRQPVATPVREQPASTPRATPEPERPQSTVPPTTAPEQAEPEPTSARAAPSASSGGGGGRELSNVALGAIAGGAILALLAIFAFLLSIMLGNRGQPAAEAVAGDDPEPSGPVTSSSGSSVFAASSRSGEPPAPAAQKEPEPEPEEPEFDEWGPRSG